MDTPHPSPLQRRGALAALSLCMLLPSLATSSASVALPSLASAFHASFNSVQWVLLAYLLATTALVVSAGRAGDALGRKRTLLAGMALFTAASAACGLAPTLPALIAARAVQGAGAAIVTALAMAFVADAMPKSRVGGGMGVLGAMTAAGTALGPSLGGFFIATVGWRWIFLANVPAGLAALWLAYMHLPRGMPQAAKPHAGPAPGRPVLLRDATVASGLAMNAIVSTLVMSTLVVGPFYLSLALQLDAARVGLVMSIGPAVVALTGMPAGRLADRFGAPRTMVVGLACTTAACFALFALPVASNLAGYISAIVVLTLGYSLFTTANNTAVMSGVDPARRGAAYGMLGLSRNAGLIAGASIMGVLFAAACGSDDLASAAPGAVAHGMRVTFGIGATLGMVAIAIALARLRAPRPPAPSCRPSSRAVPASPR